MEVSSENLGAGVLGQDKVTEVLTVESLVEKSSHCDQMLLTS